MAIQFSSIRHQTHEHKHRNPHSPHANEVWKSGSVTLVLGVKPRPGHLPQLEVSDQFDMHRAKILEHLRWSGISHQGAFE